MTVIHLVTAENAELFNRQIDEMFRLRYEYFVEGRGWDLPSDNGRERDEFDGPQTVYLLKIAPGGGVVGSFRFLPTSLPHLLAKTVPTGLGVRCPQGPTVWEVSRGVIRTEARSFTLMAEFCAAIVEFALIWDIATFVFLIDPGFFPTLAAMRWDTRPLAQPFDIAGEPCLAAELRIGPDTLHLVRQVAGNVRPMLAYHYPYSRVA